MLDQLAPARTPRTVLEDASLRVEVLTTGEENDGRVHAVLATYAPGSPRPPAHLHPAQTERFDVLQGELVFVVDGRERVVAAGESLEIAPGSVHDACNRGAAPAVVLWQTRPALRTADFRCAVAAARRGGDPEVLRAVVREYADVYRAAPQPVDGREQYLTALARSWRALVGHDPSSRVVSERGFLACVSDRPALRRAVLIDPGALPEVLALQPPGPALIVTTGEEGGEATALRAAGFAPGPRTSGLLCDLAELVVPEGARSVQVERDVDPARVAVLAGMPADLWAGVAGLRCFATTDDRAAVVVQDVGPDVVLSAVVTPADSRRQGLATALVVSVLLDARARGARSAAATSTPESERLYRDVGFTRVSSGREWVRAGR